MKNNLIKNIISIFSLIFVLILTFYLIKGLISNEVEAASNSGTTSDVQLLARAINGEARGEPYEGQVAVGAVILNRVKSSQFPNTIAGVIYEPGAFTAVADGQINVPMDGIQQVELFIILTQIQQLIHGFGQDQQLKQLENIDFVNNGGIYFE